MDRIAGKSCARSRGLIRAGFGTTWTSYCDRVEKTPIGMLGAETNALCKALKYKPGPNRTDYRTGSCECTLHTSAAEAWLKMEDA